MGSTFVYILPVGLCQRMCNLFSLDKVIKSFIVSNIIPPLVVFMFSFRVYFVFISVRASLSVLFDMYLMNYIVVSLGVCLDIVMSSK